MKHFPYDVFLSHRIGDNAHELRDQLVACGCTVWFDQNRPLLDRQLFPLIQKAHAESRVTIAYISPGLAPSPWTVLEMLTALRSEQLFGIKCLFVYGPSDALELLRTWSLPEELGSALADPERRLEAEVTLFASRVGGLNRELLPHSSVAPLSRARCIARLRRSIDGYRRRPVETADLSLSPDLPAEITGRFAESHRLRVASAALAWMEGNEEEHDFQYQSFGLRELERHLSEASVDRTPEDVALLSALCGCLVGAGRVDARAEGMYMLKAMLSGAGRRRANRLLNWSLKREPDWSLIQLFIPEADGSGSQAWPGQLPGLEAALLLSDGAPPREALAHIGPDVRMRVDTRRQMEPEDLPLKYRLELELHWLRVLTSQVREAGEKQIKLNTFDARIGMQMIDVELLHRKLNALLAQEFETATSAELEDVLDSIVHAERDLIETSERHDGAPLTSFAEYFIDHLLPILGLGILIGRQPQEFKRLGERCCSIFSTYTRLDSQEFKTYHAFWSACLEWREAHGPGLAKHLLRRTRTHGFQAELLSLLLAPDSDLL
ncbi:toll/interleukin-1 receptor domain-containing protein [Variovorax sp. YR216]|uniref:toll/interleukin-1 receptor domain-containing protein n=1 Tax=Variovorax sp. YR216 TaxID=1882828 RepID=UPI00089AAC83|nr:toll/interleukin-1 receptor domain-containing protein [Variovorax sp. YR216]SEB22623.1 hypothetical protein SAMN05444680_116105 [Variovorax sp. YR216]